MVNKMKNLFANSIRFLSIDMVETAKSGHPGMPMGMADVATVLFRDFLKFNPNDPDWFNRDRFILSAGHGSALLYSLLYLTGYKDMSLKELKNFRQYGSKTAGHPEFGLANGIEMTTGPLGQGIASSVGIALAERIFNARYGDDLVNHKTYVICSDGDLMEGISHEACSFAGHMKLSNLIVLYDDNNISIDGTTDLSFSDDTAKRFDAYNWHTIKIDGHDYKQIENALAEAQSATKPTLILCKTTIGYGSPNKANTHGVHGSPLGADEIKATKVQLKWEYDSFVIPEKALEGWRSFWERNEKLYQKDIKNFKGSKLELDIKKSNNMDFSKIINDIKSEGFVTEATRVSSGKVLEKIAIEHPFLIGGSADLTPSNNTKTKSQKVITKEDYSGNYIHYGVREHGMSAIMNGLALHGLVPYAGTFLIFSDYAKPAIRLSALMNQRVVYVMTHDSIGLGEDGPTHQPVEHLSALRAVPNLNVFRPCDIVEVAESWELALSNNSSPSVLALSRQNINSHRKHSAKKNMSSMGAYIFKEALHDLKVTIFASGSEVEYAMESASILENDGIGVRVVSVPCFELFFKQEGEYQMMFTCNNSLKVAIEAGTHFGWERLIGPHGLFFGVTTFGESAPYKDIYKHFGIEPTKIVERIKGCLN